MKKIFLALAMILIFSGNVFAGSIKLALVAPEGSTWVKTMKKMGDELEKKTAGRWTLKIYPGGISGDEKVVIKKMRIGQIDAAGFTGVGLGEIFPAVRVLELPFLFNSSKEVDYVVRKLLPTLRKGFATKGYEFLGWAEAGFVHIFSNKKIKDIDDMKGVKMWMWEGDPLAKKLFDALGLVPVPLAVSDVLMALQTNMIDAVYAPPLAAIAMQWFAKTKYMNDAKLVDSIGALLITKRTFNKMNAADQKILKKIASKYTKMLVESTREDNKKAIHTLKDAGIKITEMSKGSLKQLKAKSKLVWEELIDVLYPKTILDSVIQYLEEYRSK